MSISADLLDVREQDVQKATVRRLDVEVILAISQPLADLRARDLPDCLHPLLVGVVLGGESERMPRVLHHELAQVVADVRARR
jgi:hypothetical protein